MGSNGRFHAIGQAQLHQFDVVADELNFLFERNVVLVVLVKHIACLLYTSDADVVFHTLDIQNVVEPDLLHFVVGPHEQVTGGRNRLGRGRSRCV